MSPPDFRSGGPVFSYPFSAVAVTTAGPLEVFCVTAPSNARVAVREIRMGQYSDAGDAQAELLGLTMLTGSTAIGGGSEIVGKNYRRFLSTSAMPTDGSSVSGPSTTLSSTTSAVLFHADAWNVMAPYLWMPEVDQRPILGLGQRFSLRLTTPNDALTLNGTLVLQRLVQTPQ